MGEAYYYAKIGFRTHEEAELALPKFHEFIQQNMEVHNQGDDPENCSDFAEKYPLIAKFFEQCGCNETQDIGDQRRGDNGNVVENEIWYSAEVWHFADWQQTFLFIAKELGAIKLGWISEEDVSLFDCAELEEIS